MNIKNFYLTPIKGYQYISKMLPASCRYYPSCSEYASWQFEFNAPHKAFASSTLRILRCNQFFKGGIDYPLIHFKPDKTSFIHTFNAEYGKIAIVYWLVPARGLASDDIRSVSSVYFTPQPYYIVKDFDAIKRSS